MDTRKEFGYTGEELVQKYLQKHKYEILETNFRSDYGEIDIIALKDDKMVLCEVKTRERISYDVDPEEYLRHQQINNIVQTLKVYLNMNKLSMDDYYIQIDLFVVIDNEITRFEDVYCEGI